MKTFLAFCTIGVLALATAMMLPRNRQPLIARAINHPVILVPGNGGCQMEAKVDLASTPNFLCTKKSKGFFSVWANPKYFFPYIIDCFVDIMRLIRDPITNTTSNPPGVETRVPGFGQTETVEWLSNIHLGVLSYYNTVVEALIKKGYARGKDIRGAPYDFRKAPNELGDYYSSLKKLIENTYASNSNKSVHIVAHSLGCPITLHFLHQQSQAWKDKFIKSFISVGGVYSGSTISVKMMASGDTLGIPTVKPIWVRRSQRTNPSGHYLLPRWPAWNPNDVIGITDKKNYTISNYQQFYNDIGYPEGFAFAKSVMNLTATLRAPGVPVHCLVTRNTPTAAQFDWRGKNWPDESPKIIYGEGDGTVNWQSLKFCSNFATLQTQPVTTTMIENTDHLGVLKDRRFADHVANLV